MKKVDNKGQVSIEWIILIGAVLVLLAVIIFLVSNISQAKKAQGESTIKELNKSINEL